MSEFLYALSVREGSNLLVRLEDGAYCYVSDDDANMLLELETPEDFNIVAGSYTFISKGLEKNAD